MKRQLILFSIVVILLINIVEINATTKTCSDQPILGFLDQFLQKFDGYFEGRPEGNQRGGGPQQGGQQQQQGGSQQGEQQQQQKGKKEDLQTFIDSFKSSTAAQVTDLKICKDYNNQNSCCTANFEEKVIAKVVKGFFSKTFEKQPKNMKILRGIVHLLEKCSSKEQMLKLQQNEELKAINDEFRSCHKEGIFAQLNIIRGTVCSLCIDPAQIDTYFTVDSTSTKLKINSENFTKYEAAIQQSMTCYESVNTKFEAFFNSNTLPSQCSTSVDKIKEFFTNDKHEISKQECKKEATLMGEGCAQKLSDDNQDDTGLRRFLQTSSSGYTEVSNGLNAYLVDAEANATLDQEAQAQDMADSKSEQQYLQDQLKYYQNSSSNADLISSAILLLAGLLSIII